MPKARPRAMKYDHVMNLINTAGFHTSAYICTQGLGQGYGGAMLHLFYKMDRIPQF